MAKKPTIDGKHSRTEVGNYARGGAVRNRSATAQRRQAETRREMATSPAGMGRAERFGLNQSNAASQGVGDFPGTAGANRDQRKTSRKNK